MTKERHPVINILVAIATFVICLSIFSSEPAAAQVRGPILSWHDDPTSTMTIKWLEMDEIATSNGKAVWRSGKAGFGYGDGDDTTVLLSLKKRFARVYIRHEFQLPDGPGDKPATLHIRYDDAFIAYLNGKEIARRGVLKDSGAKASGIKSHEAGDKYEKITIENWTKLARKGTNVLAVEGHNVSKSSSDLTLDPFLTRQPGDSGKNKDAGTLVPRGATWAYLAGADAPGDWASPDFKLPKTQPTPKATQPKVTKFVLPKPISPTVVWWRQDGKPDWQKATGSARPFADTGHIVHTVILKSLTPNTDYGFVHAIVNGQKKPAKDDTVFSFRTAPSALDKPMSFVTGGDMGVGKRARAITEQAAKTDPLFALLGGDLAYANGKSTNLWLKWIDNWHELARSPDGRLIPMVVVIENHEIGSNLDPKVARQLQTHPKSKFFFSLFTLPKGKSNYTVDFGKYMSLFLLDSDHAQRAADQTDWLKQALESRKDQRFKFACYHKPTYGTAKPPNMNVRNHWVPLFEEHQITAAFENDHHTYKRTHLIYKNKVNKERGILYLGDGAWGVSLRPVPKPGEKSYLAKAESRNHFWLVELSKQGAQYKAIDHEGTVFDEYKDDRNNN